MSNLKDFLGGLDPAVWTDAKAGYLDASVSSRAAASTALTNATWTDTKAGYIDAGISTRAPSSTALSTATWTNARAGNLDNLDAPISGVGGLSSNVWTNAKAGYLDTNISSRAPSSTALSSNVWSTTYRDRIDTNVSSRLSSCSTQHLFTNTVVNSSSDYDTWTVSSISKAKSFLTGINITGAANAAQGNNARIVNSTNVRYLSGYVYGGSYYGGSSYTFMGNNGYRTNLDLVNIS
jgi:hypothetical protein